MTTSLQLISQDGQNHWPTDGIELLSDNTRQSVRSAQSEIYHCTWFSNIALLINFDALIFMLWSNFNVLKCQRWAKHKSMTVLIFKVSYFLKVRFLIALEFLTLLYAGQLFDLTYIIYLNFNVLRWLQLAKHNGMIIESHTVSYFVKMGFTMTLIFLHDLL